MLSIGIIKVIKGHQKCLYLGNLKSKRDWGHAKEFVEAQWKILQQKKADDFVIATGKSHTVKYFCELVFDILDLDYKKYVVSDKKYFRPSEVDSLKGDYKKAKKILGWEPKTSVEELAKIMVDQEMKTLTKYKKNNLFK